MEGTETTADGFGDCGCELRGSGVMPVTCRFYYKSPSHHIVAMIKQVILHCEQSYKVRKEKNKKEKKRKEKKRKKRKKKQQVSNISYATDLFSGLNRVRVQSGNAVFLSLLPLLLLF